MRYELDDLAAATLDTYAVGPPVCADLLAHRLGASVFDGGPGCQGLLIPGPDLIFVDDSARTQRRAFALAHELGHLLLRRHQLPNTEANANYLAGALLLPRLDFLRDLRRVGWDLFALSELHPNASHEALARRVTALWEDTRGWVFDAPREGAPTRYSFPGRFGLSPLEREAAVEATRSGQHVEVRAGVEAWPVFEPGWRRVIVLAHNESLRATL